MKARKPLPPALLLRCGCEIRFSDGDAVVCPTHGPQIVARTVRMPPPRIRGVATGPHVQTQDLPAWTGRFESDK